MPAAIRPPKAAEHHRPLLQQCAEAQAEVDESCRLLAARLLRHGVHRRRARYGRRLSRTAVHNILYHRCHA